MHQCWTPHHDECYKVIWWSTLPGKVKDEEEISGMKESVKKWDLRHTRIEVEEEEATRFSWVLMNEHSKYYHTKRLI